MVISQPRTMCCGHQLHASLRHSARRQGLLLVADLVYDDDLWHVVLDCLDHDQVLRAPGGSGGHLDSAGGADARVRDVTVAADLVAARNQAYRLTS